MSIQPLRFYFLRITTYLFACLALGGVCQVFSFADTLLTAKLVPAITISGPLNSLQQVQYSTNLTDPNAWTILSHVRLDTTPKPFYDDAAGNAKRFYRTKMVGVADTNLVWIPPGTFLMGSPTDEQGRAAAEGPQTLVTLTKGFLIGRFELKNSEWLIYSNTVPSGYGEPDYFPLAVKGLTWVLATNYCAVRTRDEQQRGLIPPGWSYRLPTEAEWEYACRAGTTTPFGIGNGVELRSDAIRRDTVFDGTAPYPTNAVPISPVTFFEPTDTAGYPPNGFGLHDMHGNVSELTMDYLGGSLPGGFATNLVGGLPNQSTGNQVARGGNFTDQGVNCRSATRRLVTVNRVGMRVVLIPSDIP